MEEAQEEAPAPMRRPVFIPTLKEAAINTLVRYRDCLGDIGYTDSESLRSILWNCNVEQLATVEDETLSGSERELEWYTWHLWKRLLETDLGASAKLEVPPLGSAQPPDYTHPRGISAEPGDYRTLYARRKGEMEERAAAAKERTAAAYQLANDLKDSRKAKMIDKLIPTKRPRATTTTGGLSGRAGSSSRSGGPGGAASAFLHKPRIGSRSELLAKPGAQQKFLKELGLVKSKAAAGANVRVHQAPRPPPPQPHLSSAATGHSSSRAGAVLLARTTGGQLGLGSRPGGSGSGPRMHVETQPPLVAARLAAVAAAAAARASTDGSPGGSGLTGFRARTPPSGSPSPSAMSGGKRPAADGSAAAHAQPPSKLSRPSGDVGSGGGGGGPPKPDPRVMFPRQAPAGAGRSPGSKFAVPSARPQQTMAAPSTTLGRPQQQSEQSEQVEHGFQKAGASGVASGTWAPPSIRSLRAAAAAGAGAGGVAPRPAPVSSAPGTHMLDDL